MFNFLDLLRWLAKWCFKEDYVLTDRGNSAENMGLFRRLAMNMAAVVDPERGACLRNASCNFRYWIFKGNVGNVFLFESVKTF